MSQAAVAEADHAKPEQIVIRRLGVSIMKTPATDSADGDGGDGSLEMIKEAGSYTVEVVLDSDPDYKFEFRLNGRYNDVARHVRIPFALDEEEDADEMDDEDEDNAGKTGKAKTQKKSKEMKTELKKWRRQKHANELLDEIVGIKRKSRYSELYTVSKIDLTK